MSSKISTKDIERAVSDSTGVSLGRVHEFTEAFQELFEEALLRDKQVRISGLGTFKLQWHSPRKSVNVNNGDEIEIAGHYKLNFVPEPSLAAVVNEPFAHLDAVELTEDGKVEISTCDVEPADLQEKEDAAETTSEETNRQLDDFKLPLNRLNKQAAEVKSLLHDIMGDAVDSDTDAVTDDNSDASSQATAVADDITDTSTQASVEVGDNADRSSQATAEVGDSAEAFVDAVDKADESNGASVADDDNVSNVRSAEKVNDVNTVITEEKVTLQDELAESVELGQVVEDKDELVSDAPVLSAEKNSGAGDVTKETNEKGAPAVAETEPTKPKRSRKGLLVIGIISVVLLICAVSYYYLYAADGGIDLKSLLSKRDVKTVEPEVVPIVIENKEEQEEAVVDSVVMVYDSTYYFPPQMNYEQFDKPRKLDSLLAVRTITPSDRLVTLALQYYGSKDFWVYIYEANQDILSHPNTLEVGQKIKVPVLDSILINRNDTACVNYCKALGKHYVK